MPTQCFERTLTGQGGFCTGLVLEAWGCSVSDPTPGAHSVAPAVVAERIEGLTISLSRGAVPQLQALHPTSSRQGKPLWVGWRDVIPVWSQHFLIWALKTGFAVLSAVACTGFYTCWSVNNKPWCGRWRK